MKAVKLKVNFTTGERAGGVDPRSKANHCCPTWQDLEAGYEIRMLPQEEAEKIQSMPGVTVYNSFSDAEAAMPRDFPEKIGWKVTNETLMKLSIEQLKIDVMSIPQEATQEEELEFLYKAGARGIRKSVRPRTKLPQIAEKK